MDNAVACSNNEPCEGDHCTHCSVQSTDGYPVSLLLLDLLDDETSVMQQFIIWQANPVNSIHVSHDVSLATKIFYLGGSSQPTPDPPILGDVCVVNNSPGNDADAVSVVGSRRLCFTCVVE